MNQQEWQQSRPRGRQRIKPLDHTIVRPDRILRSAWLYGGVSPGLLALVDVGGTVLATLLAILLRQRVLPSFAGVGPFMPVQAYITLWPALALLLLLRFLFGLYPGYGLNSAEELRRQTVATSLLAFFVLAGSALFQFSGVYSRLVLGETFLSLLVILPMFRSLAKRSLSATGFYGEGIWLVGQSERANDLSALLRSNPLLGYRVVGRSAGEPPTDVKCRRCLVVPDGLDELGAVLDTLNQRFRRVLLVPNLLDVSSVWITPRDLQGHLALELRNNLLEPGNRFLKRASDTVLALLMFPFGTLLLLAVAVAIRLDSPGPIFFTQTRIGRGGKPFKILKFRTMYTDAAIRLSTHLEENGAARAEWTRLRKLTQDPRVTSVGRVLRRYSVDELPQLWNVLLGDMSLVGPRAIHRDELRLYGELKGLYTAVRPGMTGLWQVSGRNHLSYEDRVRLDAFYVRNWSLWLDLVILSRTSSVVFDGDGAY